MTLVLIKAASKRLPLRTMKPASCFRGSSIERVIAPSGSGAFWSWSSIGLPVQVRSDPSINPPRRSSFITAGSPPLRWKSSASWVPAG